MWPKSRAASLGERLSALASQSEIRFGFRPSSETDFLSYFSDNLQADLAAYAPQPFRLVPLQPGPNQPQILVLTGHGSSRLPAELWEIRETFGEDLVIAVWLWDNHTDYVNNIAVALAADFVFPSHSAETAYLHTPASVVSIQVPACSAQWTQEEASRFYRLHGGERRRHRVLANYVEYEHAPLRNKVLHDLAENVEVADVLLMPSNDRSRYFDLSREKRFAEWAKYKSAIILPVSQDLSTRFFDAMLAGLIPIVPTFVTDLDHVISEGDRKRLGVVSLESYEPAIVRKAIDRALVTFDALGNEGAFQRHLFALEHHLIPNRITLILHALWLHIAGKLRVEFGDGPAGPALYSTPSE